MSTATKTSLKSELAPFQTLLLLFISFNWTNFCEFFWIRHLRDRISVFKLAKKKETFPENVQLGSFMS